MRIWVDCTAAAHPLVMRPIIELLRAGGHEVRVTARDYGQTQGLLERLGIAYDSVGRHAGALRVLLRLALQPGNKLLHHAFHRPTVGEIVRQRLRSPPIRVSATPLSLLPGHRTVPPTPLGR